MKTYVNFGVLTILIVGSLVWLAVGGISDTQTYYKTIPELGKMDLKTRVRRLRVAGDVKPGSIVHNGTQVSFTLHQGPEVLNVIYKGSDPLPDTFKDNAQAVADGRLGSDGVFEASAIQAKCASKYEAKPSGAGATHQTNGANPARATVGS